MLSIKFSPIDIDYMLLLIEMMESEIHHNFCQRISFLLRLLSHEGSDLSARKINVRVTGIKWNFKKRNPI